MTDSLTPRPSDAILGGQTPPPVTGAILGGLEGAKQRLESEAITARLSALTDAVQYGEQGLDLAIQALHDPSDEVQRRACRLLRNQAGESGKQALLKHRPLSYFTTFADWRFEDYSPAVGITDSTNNAAVVRMTNLGRSSQRATPEEAYDLSQFAALLEDPKVGELEALVFQIDYNYWDKARTFGVALEAICDAKDKLPNLKALFVGDSEGDRAPEFKKSKLVVFDIRPFLEAFPQLEVLQVFGCFGNYESYILECAGMRHEHLKTLIIETADIDQRNIEQLCTMELPALEYFELWFGRSYAYRSGISSLDPILAGYTYPNLKYLGLCSSEEVQKIVKSVVDAPIFDQLAVLDLKMGVLQDTGLEPLLSSEIPENLKVINVSGNDLSENGVRQLTERFAQVISTHQLSPEYSDHYYDEETGEESEAERFMCRRTALYE